MWNNLMFWRIVTAVLAVCVAGLSLFATLGIKRLKEGYDKSFDKAQRQVNQIQEDEEKRNIKAGSTIGVLVDLVSIINKWATTKDPQWKLEFQVTRDKLPKEVNGLISINWK